MGITMDKEDIKVLIIIPAYNEEENIVDVIEHLTSQLMAGTLDVRLSVDYLIINDGSRDSTLEICDKRHFQYLNLPINLGIHRFQDVRCCRCLIRNGQTYHIGPLIRRRF